jgi:O-antigen/teichoic acid export membrane protein
MSSFNQKILHGFAWEAITRLIVQIASWVSTIWVARLLAPEDYGVVAISGIFTGLFLTFSIMGLTNSLINKKDITKSDKANVFWASTATALLVYSLLYLAAPSIALYYKLAELELIIQVAGLMVVISPLSVVPRAILLRDLRFKEVALIAMATNLTVAITTFYLAYNGWGYWSLILSTVGAQIVELMLLFCVARYWPTRPANIKTIWPLYKYGLNILGARLVSYLNGAWPVIFTSNYLGKTPTGHFQMASTLASLPMSKIGEIFFKIAFPAFSHIQDDRLQAKRVFLAMHKYLFMIIAPMFVGIALTAPEFVPLLIGEKWLPVVMPLQIICMANILAGSALIIPRVFEGLGEASASLKYQVVVAIITPAAMLFGVQWGLKGLLIAWALSTPLSYFFLLRKLCALIDLGLSEFFASVAITCASVLFMWLAVASIELFLHEVKSLALVLIVKASLGVIAYCLAYFALGREDLSRLGRVVRSRGEEF